MIVNNAASATEYLEAWGEKIHVFDRLERAIADQEKCLAICERYNQTSAAAGHRKAIAVLKAARK